MEGAERHDSQNEARAEGGCHQGTGEPRLKEQVVPRMVAAWGLMIHEEFIQAGKPRRWWWLRGEGETGGWWL